MFSQATPEEINNAYRRFSRIYHPDKHTNPSEKSEAEMLFGKTKKAYEGEKSQGIYYLCST